MLAITRLCAVVALAGLTMTWAIAASAVTARQDAPGAGTTVPPSETEVGFPIFPSSTFLTSYDAGRGQRYYLYGTDSGFEEMVRYYSVVLDEDGDQVFNAPATHVFEIGRFREETMAFPPGVTIKDYAWNGSEGYLDPTPGSTTRYATVIQIVPVPSGATER